MVVIEMANGKKIKIELYPEIAPISCENFEKLVKQGFYDGLIFHRVIPGFMIQGGCPRGNGTGGPGYQIKGEFAATGVANDLKHTRGVLSMARAMDPDSAGSQFFVMVADAPHLDGEYAAFGKITHAPNLIGRGVKVVGFSSSNSSLWILSTRRLRRQLRNSPRPAAICLCSRLHSTFTLTRLTVRI